jgi:outer membrane lipoprotein SlyB
LLPYFRLVLPMVLLAAVGGCGPDYSPNTYSTAAVQQANKVDQGVIAGFREVAIRADGTVGAVTGGAAGGVLGAQEPDGGVVTALSAIGGTVVGGIIGTSVEHATGDTNAFEYLVRKPNGDLLSVTQKDATPLAVGLKVLVIEGKQARIVADYSVLQEVPVPPAAKNDKTDGSKSEKSDKINAAKPNAANGTDDSNKDNNADGTGQGVTTNGAPSGAVPAPAQAPQSAPAATQPAAEPHAADGGSANPPPASQAPAPPAPASQTDGTSAAQAMPSSPPAAQQPAPAAVLPPAPGDQGGGDQGGSAPPTSGTPAQAPAPPDGSKPTP